MELTNKYDYIRKVEEQTAWEDEREVRGGEEFNVCVAGTGEAGEGGRKERSCVCECIDNKA